MIRRALIAACTLLFAVGCTAPKSTEAFVRADATADGIYRFGLDLGDPEGIYDIDFYTRLDGHTGVTATPLEVTWISPTLRRYTETVWLDLSGTARTYYSRQVRVPYRRYISLREPGWWTLSVRLPDDPGLTGMGLICTKVQ